MLTQTGGRGCFPCHSFPSPHPLEKVEMQQGLIFMSDELFFHPKAEKIIDDFTNQEIDEHQAYWELSDLGWSDIAIDRMLTDIRVEQKRPNPEDL